MLFVERRDAKHRLANSSQYFHPQKTQIKLKGFNMWPGLVVAWFKINFSLI